MTAARQQPELRFDTRPRELETNGMDMLAAIRRIEAAGGFVSIMERIRGSNSGWCLRVTWPPTGAADSMLPARRQPDHAPKLALSNSGIGD